MSPRVASALFGIASLLVLADAVGAAQPSRSSAAAPGKPAGGRIYKWVDAQGVTHYGHSIPLEYREQGATEMNKGGLAVRKIDPVATPEQRREAEEKVRLQKEAQKRMFEQRRRDTALLNTYTSPREIDEARDRNLALPTQAIRGLEPRVKQAEERLSGLRAKADTLEKSGKPVPEYLSEDIEQQKLDLEGMRADIERHRSQIQAIRNRFDLDKQRYMELTELTPR